MKTVQTSAARPFRPRRPPAIGRMPALRPVRRDDGPALHRFIQALSSETRRQRFHALLSGCGPAMLAILAGADGQRHVAFVATLPAGDDECIVAEARYVVANDGESAEFALVVAEDWQGSGLADRLMDALIAQARASGPHCTEQALQCGPATRACSASSGVAASSSARPISAVRIGRQAACASSTRSRPSRQRWLGRIGRCWWMRCGAGCRRISFFQSTACTRNIGPPRACRRQKQQVGKRRCLR